MWCFTQGLESAPPRGFPTSGKGGGQQARGWENGTFSDSILHLVKLWVVLPATPARPTPSLLSGPGSC